MRHLVEHLFMQGVIQEVEPVTNRMRRIRIVGDQLRTVPWIPGQHVGINVTAPQRWLRHPRDARRTYSVRHLGQTRGSLDVCILDHGDGPGAAWSRAARPGRQVHLSHPEGRLTLRDAPYHLFVGDETAAVPFAAMLEALPPQVPVYGVLETDSPAGEVPLPNYHQLPWIHRGAAPTGSAQLLNALSALDPPQEPGTAYLAGEARGCQAIRDHLVRERGWSRRHIVVNDPSGAWVDNCWLAWWTNIRWTARCGGCCAQYMSIVIGPRRGVAAGVPFVALPPACDLSEAGVVVAWHGMDPPRTARSMAATLPLNGLNAWKIYLDLPRHGRPAAEGAVAATAGTCIDEWVVDVVGPVVERAADEFPDVLAELGALLPLGDAPLGLLGSGAGAVVAQLVLAEAGLPVRAAALVNPLARLGDTVDGPGVCGDGNCCHTESSRRVADRLDFVARAHTIVEHRSWPVLILVTGADDHAGIRTTADELWYALSTRNPERGFVGHAAGYPWGSGRRARYRAGTADPRRGAGRQGGHRLVPPQPHRTSVTAEA